MLIRRLCRVVARHDANNTVRAQALDYLHLKGLGGSPLKSVAVPLGLRDVYPVPVTAEAVKRYKRLLKQQKEAGDEKPIIP